MLINRTGKSRNFRSSKASGSGHAFYAHIVLNIRFGFLTQPLISVAIRYTIESIAFLVESFRVSVANRRWSCFEKNYSTLILLCGRVLRHMGELKIRLVYRLAVNASTNRACYLSCKCYLFILVLINKKSISKIKIWLNEESLQPLNVDSSASTYSYWWAQLNHYCRKRWKPFKF